MTETADRDAGTARRGGGSGEVHIELAYQHRLHGILQQVNLIVRPDEEVDVRAKIPVLFGRELLQGGKGRLDQWQPDFLGETLPRCGESLGFPIR